VKKPNDGNVGWHDLAQQALSGIPKGDETMAKKEKAQDGMLPRATDFIGKGEDFEGCISVEETEGRDFILNNVEFLDTQWGEAVKMYVRFEGEDVVILSFSQVLTKQAHKLQEHLPVRACIEKVKRYWRFA